MTNQEAQEQAARIWKFRKLEQLHDEIYHALKAVTEPWTTQGPCGQGPFTSNTRESRQVRSMTIRFTATRGGAPAVALEIQEMNIEAPALGRFLESELRAKLEAVRAEMEKL